MNIEEKLKNIVPIRNLADIKAGKEWNNVAFIIKDKIIGRADYRKASEQKDALNIHIVEAMNNLGILGYEDIKQVILKVFSNVFPSNKLLEASSDDISYTVDKGILKFFHNEEEVEICWCPSIEENKRQILLSYDEHNRLKRISENATFIENPISNIGNKFTLEDIVKDALQREASDIHIANSAEFYNVFFRIYGRLELQSQYSMTLETGLDFINVVKQLTSKFTKGGFEADVNIEVQDGKIEYPNIGLDGVDVRLVFIPDGKLKHMSVTARILKREHLEKADFEKNGYYPDLVEKIEIVGKRQNGLVVSSGITGSGKSTFISNIITNIDANRRVFTIEDPIEYFIPNSNVTQHQVYERKASKNKDEPTYKVGFKEYTKGLKRADPDVVSIGEMRNDPELIQSIFEMSEAGQLVFTTVHITTAFAIYDSMKDIFKVAPEVSVPLILFSINQVLVDKLCNNCKEEDTENENIQRLLAIKDNLPYHYKVPLTALEEESQLDDGSLKLYKKGKGCSHCSGKGYVGRLPIYEYFFPNVEFKEWILEQSKFPSRFKIEQEACIKKIGVNKLDTFCRRLREGSIDASDSVIYKIM